MEGSVSADSIIEFQIFRPAQNAAEGAYNLVYGNRPTSLTNKILQITNTPRSICVTSHTKPNIQIPVTPGDIVGIRLKSGTDPNFGLRYESNTAGADGVDVYYWQGMGSQQACNLSICDSSVSVLRGITSLLRWDFCECMCSLYCTINACANERGNFKMNTSSTTCLL